MGRSSLRRVLFILVLMPACTTAEFEYLGGASEQPNCDDGCAQECPSGTREVAGQCVVACGPWSASVEAGNPAAAIFADDKIIAVGTNALDSGRTGASWAIALDECRGEFLAGARPWASVAAQIRGVALFQDEVYVTGSLEEPAAAVISRLSKADLSILREDALVLAVPEPRVHATAASSTGVWLSGSSAAGTWAAKTDPKGSCPVTLDAASASSVEIATEGDAVWIATSDGSRVSLFQIDDANCSAASCGCTTKTSLQVSLPSELSAFELRSISADQSRLFVTGAAGSGEAQRGVLLELSHSGALQKAVELDLSPGVDEVAGVLVVAGKLYAAVSVHIDSAADVRTLLRRYALPLTDTPEVDVSLGDFRAASISLGPDDDVLVVGDSAGAALLHRCNSAGACNTETMPVPMPP
jgi:hypothetical protein